MSKIALAIHGGAGTILRSAMTPELEAEYRRGLQNALSKGWEILDRGGSALDSVEAATCSLEDFHLFNAGRGSVFTHEGKNEMDASIMDGSRMKAGAVAFVKNVRNPIKLARLVMERTEHILLAGAGANEFARQMDVDFEDDAYFFTDHRYQQLLTARDEGVVELDHTGSEAEIIDVIGEGGRAETRPAGNVPRNSAKPVGTVGAVACDSNGNLAAATSTGGMTNKKFGRIGDTPLIGAGTYADEICAVSCTGHGEFFMLGVTAFDVAARMKYKGLSLEAAANETIARLTSIGGEGGLIAVDSHGNITMPFNSDGMYRGSVDESGTVIDIYA
jgi:beta-aspartyl-peptidase (threonine type)